MKKSLLFTILSGLILCLACGPEQAEENLLKNSSFEKAAGNLPASWKTDFWSETDDTVSARLETTGAYEGTAYVTITSTAPADAKLFQQVKVKPKSIYKLSGYIKASAIPGKSSKTAGANLSVLGLIAMSDSVYETNGNWQYVEVYGRTGPKQNRIEVVVRLGGYSSPNSGTASFDKIDFSRITNMPPGKAVIDFYNQPSPPVTPVDTQNGEKKKSISLQTTIILAILYLVLFTIVYWFLINRPKAKQLSSKKLLTAFFSLAAIALSLRIILSPIIYGFPSDIDTFKAWINWASSRPMFSFYNPPPGFFDYPPGSIYLFALIGNIARLFRINYNSGAFLILLKLPAGLADIITAFLIYKLAGKRLKETTAIGLATLYLFNPGVFLNSAIWGQIESISSLLVMLVLVFITTPRATTAPVKENTDPEAAGKGFMATCQKIRKALTAFLPDNYLWLASILFVLAVLMKWQSGFLVLALLFALIQKNSLKTWLLSAAGGLVTMLLIVLPFSSGQNPIWLIQKFASAMSTYKGATVNMFNFYSLFKGAWPPLETLFLGLPYSTWGIIFAVITLGLCTFLYIKAKDISKYYVVSLLFIAMIVLLYIIMHERYIFPVLFLSLMCVIYTKDKRFFYIFLGFSLTVFFNLSFILDNYIRGPFYVDPKNPVVLGCSIANMLILLYLLKVTINLYVSDKFLTTKMFRKEK